MGLTSSRRGWSLCRFLSRALEAPLIFRKKYKGTTKMRSEECRQGKYRIRDKKEFISENEKIRLLEEKK